MIWSWPEQKRSCEGANYSSIMQKNMKVVVLGSGGREHAISWKLAQDLGWDSVYTLPGNGGIPNSQAVDIRDFNAIHSFCQNHWVELIVVGPEVPLAAGIVNFFEASPIKVFGPDKAATRLEGSKIWAKQFMQKYGVPTADFQAFTKIEDARNLITEKKGNLVIKYDGLAAGKGVFVCDDTAAAHTALDELKEKYGATCNFLIEDRIIGDEISIMGITDGKNIQLLQTSQDHKQLLDGDAGPNTGGMGAICPVPFCDDALLEEIKTKIVVPTVRGLAAEAYNYKGFIYFGLMLGKQGVNVLEYNSRLGDPEAEVLLPALKDSLLDLILACFDGSLSEKTPSFEEGYFVDIVQVSGGYPKAYSKGYPIEGLDQVRADTLVFHAGTKKIEHKIYTNGGRVVNIVARGTDLETALVQAYKECEKISFKDHFYRKDIGKRQPRQF